MQDNNAHTPYEVINNIAAARLPLQSASYHAAKCSKRTLSVISCALADPVAWGSKARNAQQRVPSSRGDSYPLEWAKQARQGRSYGQLLQEPRLHFCTVAWSPLNTSRRLLPGPLHCLEKRRRNAHDISCLAEHLHSRCFLEGKARSSERCSLAPLLKARRILEQ